MTNHVLIGSRSSLNTGESWWTQDILSNSLNCFTNRSKFEKRREEHRFLRRNSREKCRPFDPVKGRLMATIARWSWAINVRQSWATIVWRMSHDRAGIMSHDHAAIMSHDRVMIVSHDLTWICVRRPIAIIASRWVQMCPRVSPTMCRNRDESRPFDEDLKLAMPPRVTPRSHDATHAFHLFCPSNEDQKLLMRPRVDRWVIDRGHLSVHSRTCFDGDCVDSGPRNRRPFVYRDYMRRPRHCHIACKEESPRNIVPHGEKKMKHVSI